VITIRQAGQTDAATIRRITVAAYQRYVARMGREPALIFRKAVNHGGPSSEL
jgi:hypothetical protein